MQSRLLQPNKCQVIHIIWGYTYIIFTWLVEPGKFPDTALIPECLAPGQLELHPGKDICVGTGVSPEWGNGQFVVESVTWGIGQFVVESVTWGIGQFVLESVMLGNGQFVLESVTWGI